MGTAATPLPAEPVAPRSLSHFAVAVVVATLILIKAGAMVTSTGSGLAFADWPLSDGSWWPPNMGLDGLLEHGHRAIGATIGLLVLILTIWIWIAERRTWLRRLAAGTLGMVVLQGVIGGVGVLEKLPAVTSVTHGVLAQVILCTLTLIAFALSASWQASYPLGADQVRGVRKAAVVALVLVFVQLTLGALLRHTNANGLLWLHVFMAMVVSLAIMIAALYGSTRCSLLRGLTRNILWLLGAQLILGFITLAVRSPKDPTNVEYVGRSLLVTSHVVVGALLFLSSSLLVYRSFRNLTAAPS